MKQFVIKVFVLTFLVLVSAGFILYINPVDQPSLENDYIATIIDKHERLSKCKSPRIIFAGGSNLAFGLDSKMLEDSLKIPIINMGLHALLGLPFILNEVKPELRKGDILVLSIEYYLMEGNFRLMSHAVNFYPPAMKYIPLNKIEQAFYSFKDNLAMDVRQIQKTVIYGTQPKQGNPSDSGFHYTRNIFSIHGDIVAHLKKPSLKKIPAEDKLALLDYNKYLDLLNAVAEIAKHKEAKIYFAFPPYPSSEFKRNAEAIKYLKEQMDHRMKVEILGQPQDFVFPESYFFNTAYHLNAKGREERSIKLLSLLKKKL